jgi:hypothetical protein
MSKLQELFTNQGQSPWLDNLRRSYLATGRLQKLVDGGVRGVTPNPRSSSGRSPGRLTTTTSSGFSSGPGRAPRPPTGHS